MCYYWYPVVLCCVDVECCDVLLIYPFLTFLSFCYILIHSRSDGWLSGTSHGASWLSETVVLGKLRDFDLPRLELALTWLCETTNTKI